MENLTLSKASAYIGFKPKTLQRWDREGLLKSRRTKTNRRYYFREDLDEFIGKKRNIIPDSKEVLAYCRVSSRNQLPDLKNQRLIVEEFCSKLGLYNVEFIEEIGGGLNFKRKKFLEVIDKIIKRQVSKIIIAHKDRLSRFGFELIEHLCKENHVELIIINLEKLSPEQEMVQDLMTIIHCFSSRLYGLRNYKKALKESLKQNEVIA